MSGRNVIGGPFLPSGEVNDDHALRMEFLELSAADAQRLRALSPVLERFLDEFVDGFYAHLCRFERTAAFLSDPQTVVRLKEAQKQHFCTLLAAQWDEAYFESRIHVGRVHAEAGVDPHFFLAAYNQYLQHCLGHINELPQNIPQILLPVVCSLVKAVFLDLGLSVEAYFTQSTRDLYQALNMYWNANEQLRQIARVASHDLKTPLATVANICDELLDDYGDQIPDEARKLIRAASRRTLDMSTMIDELRGSVEMCTADVLQEIPAGEALRAAVNQLQSEIKAKQIELSLPPSLPAVWGNTAWLREVFFNLLSNALRFIDKRPGRIEVEVETQDQHCIVCVSDNGCGIPREEQPQIFAPFRRSAQHREGAGPGLGLYFTRQLVEQQHGTIWVKSQPGQGSQFFVRLWLGAGPGV